MDLCGALLSSKIKHIMHLHGILDKKYRWGSKVNLDCLRCGVTESLGVRLSAKLIAVSQFIKMEIVNKYGVNPNQINVVYPGIDLNLYSPNKRSALSTTSGVNDLTLISTGAIAERKGQHLLVDVMNEIVKEEPRASLLLIGRTGVEDSSYILKLQERIRKYHLTNNVLIKGFLPANLMPNAYAQADIFVTGTMWEGFGMPIAEAMSSGIPVVTFDTTAMHELITDGINGFKTPAFDIHIFAKKLLQLIQDSKLRQEMGKNGRKYSEKYFDLKKNTNQIMNIYG